MTDTTAKNPEPIPIVAGLSKLQIRVLLTLADGKTYCANHLNNIHKCNSQSVIRYLRDAGYSILDRWCKTSRGQRPIKYYYLNRAHPLKDTIDK